MNERATSRASPKIASTRPQWRPDFPMAHILPHWNWLERVDQITPVHVYTSGDEAELFLNGKSLGRKKKLFEWSTNQQINGQPAYRIRWDDVVFGELVLKTFKERPRLLG